MDLSDTQNAAERCLWQDVKEASSPSQSGRKAPRKGGRDLGDDILASHCAVAWYEIRIQLWFETGTGFVSPDDLPQSDEEDEDQAKADIV